MRRNKNEEQLTVFRMNDVVEELVDVREFEVFFLFAFEGWIMGPCRSTGGCSVNKKRGPSVRLDLHASTTAEEMSGRAFRFEPMRAFQCRMSEGCCWLWACFVAQSTATYGINAGAHPISEGKI